FEERKRIILEKAKKIAEEKNGFLFYDDKLLDEVTGLVEYPGLLIGKFPEKYLELPEDFIITAMRVHQRYFAIKDKNGKILPYFITCINNDEKKVKGIIENFEKVLIARLEDAEFYMKEDLKVPLEKRIEILKEIYWDEELGSVYDKVLRMKKFFESIYFEDIDREIVERALILSRTDLTTEMIKDGKEFTLLEGIVASEYAKRQGENEKVVKILREFLKPKSAEDSLPELKESAILGIIDRWDSFIGYFLKGYRPTGSKDPLGLKKILYGFFDLLIHFKLKFSIKEWIEKMVEIYNREADSEEISRYLFERYDTYLEEKRNIRYDIADAVISGGDDNLYRIYLKAYFLNEYYKKDKETFLGVVIGQKRVRNIIEDENIDFILNPSIFEKEEEKKLFNKMEEIKEEYIKSLKEERFEDSILYLFSLKPYIDKFFDNVFVMTENITLRKNRLSLLKNLKNLFDQYADFSKISVSVKELEEIKKEEG
ncbi:MAG: glycine--tRNA ligase subunit beta, partial [candidate division WOR-3 bacterium]